MDSDYGFASLIGGLVLAIFGVCYGISHLNKSSMQQLGYEAKVVNMDCFAKVNNRWLLCEAVMKNQHEVVLK